MDRQVRRLMGMLEIMPDRYADGEGSFFRRGHKIFMRLGHERYLVAVLTGGEILIQQTLPGFWSRPDEPNAA